MKRPLRNFRCPKFLESLEQAKSLPTQPSCILDIFGTNINNPNQQMASTNQTRNQRKNPDQETKLGHQINKPHPITQSHTQHPHPKRSGRSIQSYHNSSQTTLIQPKRTQSSHAHRTNRPHQNHPPQTRGNHRSQPDI